MEEDLLTNLPQEINLDILSRLPVPTVMICKCVCKSWRNLVESLEFANSHLSKSVPGLVAQQLFTGHRCKVLGFNPRCDISFSFCLPRPSLVKSSLDGLLVMITASKKKKLLYICNPVTREYITLLHPPGCPPYKGLFHGFGVSKMTRQYKLVMIVYSCEIYTLGTGCWRSIPADGLYLCSENESDQGGVFLNGNLHWLAIDSHGTKLEIRCLDLETELFSTLSFPSPHLDYAHKSLTAWGGRLYLLHGDSVDGEIVVWSMKEYGDEKSWTRDLVIEQRGRRNFCPIKVFKDDDFLLSVGYGGDLVFFSTKTNTIRTIRLPRLYVDYYTYTFAYTPSFLPVLKSFVKENVSSF